MKDHKAIHNLVGIENTEEGGFHHPHFHLAKFVPMGEGLYAGGGGLYANAGASGGRLSKIGNALDKAFNPKYGLLNSVSKVVDKKIVKPLEHNGNQILNGAKVVGHYVIPATISTLGGLAGGLATGGNPLGAIAGSASGAYAGDQVNRALGIQGNTSFNGKGLKRRGRPPKGGNIKRELEKVWEKVPHEFHKPLEDLGRAGVEYAGFKLPPRKHERHERGKGVKGCPSKTRKGDMDYTTKKGDKDYHRGGHDESEPESESDTDSEKGKSFDGGSLKKKRPHMVKGSVEAKEYMRMLREKRKGKGKVVGSGLSQNNNSPQEGHIRVSPYSNF
jgi:hypothetical protein